jgi:hypothetical protein
MTSLRSTLNALIKEKGYLSYEEIVRITLEEGYKPSNAERRLRHSESPDIEPVMAVSKRGTSYIKGYIYKDSSPPEEKKEIGFVTIAGKRIEIYK